ncbi:MAG: hypothetical protein SGILL_000503 [Bacillariaceae sp.]
MMIDFHPDDKRLLLYHFDSTTSTQDEAKRIAEAFSDSNDEQPFETFCVTTTSQSSGRGTSGRQWLGAPGNIFVTIGIPMATWMKQTASVPLTLLPLKIGTLTAQLVQALLEECRLEKDSNQKDLDPFVTVKWPNDVLCDGNKISGTLIESANGWFLIGVGINLEYAPKIPTTGANHGRSSTSVRDYCSITNRSDAGEDDEKRQRYERAHRAGVELAYKLHSWLHIESDVSAKTSDSILGGWQQFVDWDMELVMRDTPNRERVKLVDVLPDGRVKVKNVNDGTRRS